MYDLHRPLAFGGNVDPTAADPTWPIRLAQAIDAAGLEFIGIQDHPYNATFLDTWTLLATLTQATQQVRFFPNVANLPLRPPAMLAKQAATIDALSGGRFELGLGAGAFAEAIAGMGGPRRSPGRAREALSEAIDIIRASWAGEPYRHEGEHYAVPAARPGPRPAHDIGIWLGATGPRALRLLGAKADGWSVSSTYVPPERLAGLNAAITESATEAGRDPGAILRLYNVAGLITDAAPGDDQATIHGPVAHWTDTLLRLHAEHGMTAFVYWPARDRERQSRVFAEDVVPAVRERLRAAA
jgi:alkanesulfonate monooxygenase SsuD/methylene tetrahydromethanopterin reductase-like flavin-dependent oxidoreductase (luciferase family)